MPLDCLTSSFDVLHISLSSVPPPPHVKKVCQRDRLQLFSVSISHIPTIDQSRNASTKLKVHRNLTQSIKTNMSISDRTRNEWYYESQPEIFPCSPACYSQQACVQNVCVGIGHLSCTMIWSRTGDADIVIATPNNKIIYYNNVGPAVSTDQGRLDVDNTNETVPSTGTYYVCLSEYHFNPNVTSANPITATLKIMRSTNSTLIFTKTM